ncbi:MAG: 3-methyl-2-oxobutanoate dehydrogenase subunit VorB [Methanomassiliicoccaceae archaeon]|jgi:2-oxoglutarate ferredoxin oxidoreductase subunit alpha|nr:3-methyl-2-oxobutanoate dehydrogenase subunit VorB [Methanomassiliicoccaceae archaeon]
MTEKILMKGNEALAEAAILAGCRHFFGYPITPQTELAAHMSKRMPKIGGVYLQAESEVAAINMVIGASAAGARAMTSSSSPGISLKSEGLSYLAGSDLPAVIVNVQRAGPGLGGIQPSQADYWQATRAPGHGDFRLLVFAPSTVQEMVDLVGIAFDLGDKYRMPAIILSDGLLGQMMEPVVMPAGSNTKVPERPWATCGHGGKREHNIINSLYIDPPNMEAITKARFRKYEEIKEKEQRREEYLTDDADVVLVAYGASARISRSAVDMARKEGIKAGLIRPITLWPFPDKAILSKKAAKAFLCVEMSMGQMVDDVRLAINGKKDVIFFGRTGGMVPTPAEVLKEIKKIKGGI